jgi:anti-sigma regulatory factor (Ser/Thr protein kinase)
MEARLLLVARVNHRRMEAFSASLALDLAVLRPLRGDLVSWLERGGVAGEAGNDIVLATHEAAANAIEHAEPGSEVTVRAARHGDNLIVVVANVGAWKKAAGHDGTRGRGLALIRDLMSNLEVQTRSGRTTVRMRKSLSA